MGNVMLIVSYICYQAVCAYKDYWTYPNNTSFRGKKYITGPIFLTGYLSALAVLFQLSVNGKYSFAEVTGMIQIPMCLCNWFFIKNSFQHYARYEIYWMTSFFVVTSLLGIFHIPYEMFDEFQDFQDAEVLFWTYLIMTMSLLICHFIWKQKVFHGIPQELCNSIYIVVIILMIWSPKGVFNPYLNRIFLSVVQLEIVFIIISILAVIGTVLWLQKARMLKVKYYYECFYRYAEQTQKKLGVLRHEFANHREVMRYLPEDSEEKERYKERLDKIYEEAKVPEITGLTGTDRFFYVFWNLQK